MILHFIDAIIFLVTGRTVGDRVANTYVIFNQVGDTANSEKEMIQKINSYTPPKNKKRWKIVLIILSVLAVLFAIAFTVSTIVLEQVKKTDEYKLAYAYLIDSGVLDIVNATADDVSFNGFEGSVGNGTADRQYTFNFKGYSATVVCHEKDGEWFVCSDCTGFGDGIAHERLS